MVKESRSLWEQLDSDVEPWRRGRAFLVCFGVYQFLIQVYLLLVIAFAINIEQTIGVAVGCILFWFLFYFVWIGIQWTRWLWGAWDLIVGFCLSIWGWRDSNSLQILFGALTFVIGFILCFSPSIYFFAKRQRETVRWLEATLMGGLCLVLLCAIGVACGIFIGIRENWRRDATAFAMEANHRIYQDYDYQWVQARVTPESAQRNGEERLKNFFRVNRQRLGRVARFDEPRSRILIRLTWPIDLTTKVWVDCAAKGPGGSDFDMHEIVVGEHGDWRLDRMWWEPVPERK